MEPPAKKFKGTERDLPEELVAVQRDRGANLDAALELVSAFHVNDIGLHEQWLGCGLLLEWTAHADYSTGGLTVELVENITRYQDPEDVQDVEPCWQVCSASRRLWNSTLKPIFCASEHAKTSTKMRSGKLLAAASSGAPSLEASSAEKIPQTKGSWLAGPEEPPVEPVEEPAEEIGVTQVDPVEEEEENVDMAALTAAFCGEWDGRWFL